MKNTVEQKTAETILQTPFTIELGGKTYEVARPTLATLIEVSKFISQLPEIEIQDEESVLKEVLSVAFDCGYLADIVAILILGSKGIKTHEKIVYKKVFGLSMIKRSYTVYPQKELAAQILEDISPKELFEITIILLQKLEVSFFLSTLIFLKDVNLLRKTKI